MQRIPERFILSFTSKSPVKLEVAEESESRPLSSDMVIDLAERSEVGHQHQHPLLKVSLLMLQSLKRRVQPLLRRVQLDLVLIMYTYIMFKI